MVLKKVNFVLPFSFWRKSLIENLAVPEQLLLLFLLPILLSINTHYLYLKHRCSILPDDVGSQPASQRGHMANSAQEHSEYQKLHFGSQLEQLN